MTIHFYKFQGAGNDFVVVDDRANQFDQNNVELINFLCDRRFGVGADGFMLLRNHADYDFEMLYYNADGKEGSMCGNGGRCIVAFANHLGITQKHCKFMAVDGEHEADISKINDKNWVSLKMINVTQIEKGDDFIYLNTGSPHYVQFVNNLPNFPVFEEGKKIRYNERFKAKGTNVNFIEVNNANTLSIRTYERGVEDETLACGTGVTAAALSAHQQGKITTNEINVKAQGGDLKVLFETNNGSYQNIWLQGPAELVYKGEIDV